MLDLNFKEVGSQLSWPQKCHFSLCSNIFVWYQKITIEIIEAKPQQDIFPNCLTQTFQVENF